MGRVIRVLTLFAVVTMQFGCASTLENRPSAEYSSSSGRANLKVALIISDELKNYVHKTYVQGRCWGINPKGNVFATTGVMNARIMIGPLIEDQIKEDLSGIFNVVHIYRDPSEIKNTSDYDYYVVMKVSVNTSYEEDKVKRRNLNDANRGFKIYADTGVTLELVNASNNQIDLKLEQVVRTDGSSMSSYCSANPGDYGGLLRELSSDYRKIINTGIREGCRLMSQKVAERATVYAQSKSQERALPSSLSLAIRFTDDSSFFPNKVLDAGEEAQVFVTVKNDGKGAGYGTILKVASENPKVIFDKEVPLGDIPPGGTKDVKVKVKAGLDIQDGTVPFIITCSEKRGYDCKKYTLNVQSSHYEKPELVITGYRINDGSAGLGQGNGNGIPENGETIEVIPMVKNTGRGTAYNVALSFQSLSSNLEARQKSTTIPQILPGQVAAGNLSFFIPTTFAGRGIEFTFSATDIRGASGTSKQFALATEINQPSLAYSYRIIDQKGSNRTDIQNGEYGEIEIRPSNKGKMEARNVSINLSSEGVSFSKSHDEILRIGSQAEYSPIRFPFQVPRVTDKKSVDIVVKLSQRDFPGISDTINIPIRLVRPEFRVIHQLLSNNKTGSIEQGESGELLIQVENIGRLDANNVVLGVSVQAKGVSINVPKEVNLGKIEAGKSSEQKRFPIFVQRNVPPGELPILFIVSEQNFGTKNITLALNIAKEQSEVITVKGQEMPKQPVPVAQYNRPPTIAIATPYDDEHVASDTITLRGVATDDKAVAQIDILVNGRRLEGRGVRVRGQDAPTGREREFFETIPLTSGKNTITITAYDTDHLSTSKTINVYQESKKGQIWAAVIGINKYRDPSINLKYARNDAEAFANYLRTNMGLDSGNLFELYDEQATTRNIRSLLGTKLRQRANKPEDTVFVFFAGHGAPEQDSSAKDEDKIKKYILTHDADREELFATTIAMDEIAEIFGRINADRVVFLIDSCYSGAGGGRTPLARQSRAILSEDFLNRLSQGKGRIILASSKPNEVSDESDDLKHGYFTYYLLEGLNGKADINGDGVIDLDEISLYLNKTVPERTKGGQHPVKKGEAEGQVIIGKVR